MSFLPQALALVLVAPALFAQWPAYNTTAAPKAIDGHPDLSGVWDRGVSSTGGPRPFQDLPSMFPDGLPLQLWAAELRQQRKAENSKGHPDAHCLPLHPVQLHFHPQPRKIVQTPNEVVIIYEANDGLRQIFTDGRALPADVDPWWFGYSAGTWDGDTLVVQSTGFKDKGWLDEEGTPITTGGRVTERFRRPDFNTLEIELTVDDPDTFTKPWTIKFSQKLMPNTELIEFVCQEDNRSLPHLVGK